MRAARARITLRHPLSLPLLYTLLTSSPLHHLWRACRTRAGSCRRAAPRCCCARWRAPAFCARARCCMLRARRGILLCCRARCAALPLTQRAQHALRAPLLLCALRARAARTRGSARARGSRARWFAHARRAFRARAVVRTRRWRALRSRAPALARADPRATRHAFFLRLSLARSVLAGYLLCCTRAFVRARITRVLLRSAPALYTITTTIYSTYALLRAFLPLPVRAYAWRRL